MGEKNTTEKRGGRERAERSVRKFCHEEHTKRFWLMFPMGADKIETTESEGGLTPLNGGHGEKFQLSPRGKKNFITFQSTSLFNSYTLKLLAAM